jgi:hypothetical protein
LINVPTYSQQFWSRSDIAALLDRPTSASGDSRLARTHQELLREIELAARDAPAAVRELFLEGAIAARAVSDSIARSSEELLQVARDADPQERARIDAGLAALGAATADEPDRKRQMRELLTKQLALVIDLEERRSELIARRERLMEQLRTLALNLAGLRAANANAAVGADETTGRVRALIREIDQRIEGAREVQDMLAPRTTL